MAEVGELRNCPFCDRPAELYFVTGLAYHWHCGCPACKANIEVKATHSGRDDPKRDVAIAAWNRRAPDPERDELREALRDLLTINDPSSEPTEIWAARCATMIERARLLAGKGVKG